MYGFTYCATMCMTGVTDERKCGMDAYSTGIFTIKLLLCHTFICLLTDYLRDGLELWRQLSFNVIKKPPMTDIYRLIIRERERLPIHIAVTYVNSMINLHKNFQFQMHASIFYQLYLSRSPHHFFWTLTL